MILTDTAAKEFAGALSVLMDDLPRRRGDLDEAHAAGQRCDCGRPISKCTLDLTDYHGDLSWD